MNREHDMAKALYEALQMDLPALAEMLRRKGRGKDTILAHITPKEAELLKKRGGRGSTNPDTGLLEFETDFGGDIPVYSGGEAQTPAQVAQQYPDLYAGGQAPTAAQETVYTPATDTTAPSVAYQPTTTTTPSPTPSPYDVEDLAAGQYAGKVPTGQAITGGYYPEGASVYSPIKYSPEDLSRISVGLAPSQEIPAATTAKTPTDKLSNQDLIRLGLAGGLSGLGLLTSRQAAGQNVAQQQQQQQIAQPYQAQGQQLIAQAQAGTLSPASLQALQAAQAQINQNVATRGGVGAQQAANQVAGIYQQLLANQYNQGLQISQIGDQIALGAIRTGMQLDTQLNNANKSFYTQIASIAAGLPLYGTVPRG
jgi:hypothetical protein